MQTKNNNQYYSRKAELNVFLLTMNETKAIF